MKALSQRVALVTGASSGIGEAAAEALAAAGTKVVVTARRQDKLDALVARIEAAGGTAHAVAGDIKDEAFARDLIDAAIERFGAIDILINSAGTIQKGAFLDADTDEWRDTFDLNLFAPLYTAVAALPHMAEQGEGDIVQISSTGGRRPTSVFASYGASKHALNGMSWSLREEAGKHGVRVTVIEPGAVQTGIHEQVTDPQMKEFMKAHTGKDDAIGADELAGLLVVILALPQRVNVQELLIRPTSDTTPI